MDCHYDYRMFSEVQFSFLVSFPPSFLEYLSVAVFCWWLKCRSLLSAFHSSWRPALKMRERISCSPLATPTVLLGFLLPWTWGISSWLLQQIAAAAPYLGRGVSPHHHPSWPSTWDSSSRPSCPHAATAPWTWGWSSLPPPLASGMGAWGSSSRPPPQPWVRGSSSQPRLVGRWQPPVTTYGILSKLGSL